MPTLAEQLIEAAADADRRAEHHRQEATRYEHMAALLRSQAAGEQERLTTVKTDDTLPGMDVNTEKVDVKRGAGRSTRKSKAQRRLYLAGYTISSIAKKLGEGRPRVSSWFSEGDGNRPIPRRIAERLRDLAKIPLDDWPRIAD